MGNVVILQVKDAIGIYRNAEFWSSDGTTSGNLIPVSILSDTSGNVMLPASQSDITTLQQSLSDNLQNVVISSGNIAITNWPVIQQIVGNVNVTSGNSTITNWPVIQQIVGNVNVSMGSVNIDNFPATQNVNIVAPVSIANFPTTQPVSGTVSISNFPNRQAVVGETPFEAIASVVRTSSNLTYTTGQLINNANVGMATLPVITTGLGSNTRVIINNVVMLSNNGTASPKANFGLYLFPTAAPSSVNLNDGNLFTPDSIALISTGVGFVGNVNISLPTIGTSSYGYQLTGMSTQAQTDTSGNLYAAIILENSYDALAGEIITVKITGKY